MLPSISSELPSSRLEIGKENGYILYNLAATLPKTFPSLSSGYGSQRKSFGSKLPPSTVEFRY